jgi:putative hydrolase of the HAD superfamily
MSSPPVRCVAFDAVGTLIAPDPPVAETYWQAARRHGSRRTLDEVEQRFRAAWRTAELARGCRTSEPQERKFWQDVVCETLDDATDPEACFAELHAHFAKPTAWRVFPDVAEALATLSGRGLRLAVASNFDERLLAVCDGLRELAPLQTCVVSSCVGWKKPSAEFYAGLVKAVGCAAREVLMVGDTWDSDVQAARDAGLQAVLIDRAAGASDADCVRSLVELAERWP